VIDPFDGLLADIAAGAWFAACGAPLSEGERAEAARYAAGLGFVDAVVTPAGDWRAAAAVTQRPDWSRPWWEREGAEAARLLAMAASSLGAAALRDGLSRVAQASSSLAGAAALALARSGSADETLHRVAAGAAAQACHHAALARVAARGADHVFAVKFRLFAGGRWPLGVFGKQFFLL
jgi:hypothetical protein